MKKKVLLKADMRKIKTIIDNMFDNVFFRLIKNTRRFCSVQLNLVTTAGYKPFNEPLLCFNPIKDFVTLFR